MVFTPLVICSYGFLSYAMAIKMREIAGFRSVGGFSIANLVGSKLNIRGVTICV